MRPFARLLLLLALLPTHGQLPVARLTAIFPPGAQIGVATEVKVDGSDLDDAKELRFSHPAIAAKLKTDGRFTITADTNVPPGIYDVRVIGRFGASSPRAFVIGDAPEILNAGTNKSVSSAQEISLDSVVNGKLTPHAPDFFKVNAHKGQRLLFECLGKRIDSKIDPSLVLYDSVGKTLERARTGGLLDFTAPSDGEYVIRVHDVQFRGGDDFWYRLSASKGPWIDFAFPAAVQAGSKTKITLHGRNLPNSKPSPFKIDGKGLEQLEIEVEAPSERQPSYINRRPADAVVEGFEYRFASSEGFSNPILLSFASATPVLPAKEITVPCEVQGQFFPSGDVDVYQFEAAKGDVFTIEVFSQRLGLNTDPFAVVQRVTKNEKGEEQISDVQEMYDYDQNVGGPEFNTATRDPIWRLEAKEGGTYRIRVRDLFDGATPDPRRVYRLSIRKEAPDFRLLAYSPAPPPLNKDSKEVGTAGAFLRRGDSIPIRILALRRDNFGGEIEVGVENLPTGVSATPLKLAAGVNSGLLIISATENAFAWTGPLRIVGKAKVGDNEIVRAARAGNIVWNIGDYNNEAVTSQLVHELVLSVSGAEVAPLAIAPGSGKPIEGLVDSKVTIPLTILRRGEFGGALKFRAMVEPPKEFEVDGKATNTTFEIDLKQAKPGPGIHNFPVYATSPGRYRRITPEEAKAIEAEIKTLKESLAGVTEAPKKEEANNRIKSLESRLQYKDVTATVYTSFALSVLPAAQKTP